MKNSFGKPRGAPKLFFLLLFVLSAPGCELNEEPCEKISSECEQYGKNKENEYVK